MKRYKLLISAAGTGGHILPGLSIYDILKMDNHEVKFICRKADYNFIEDLQNIKNDLIFFPGTGLRRRLSVRNILFAYYLIVNLIRSFILFFTFYPDAVICMGGYITFPILVISYIFKIPFFLCEQNSYPGIVNRIFGPHAQRVFVNFKYSTKFFQNSMLTGNPIPKKLKEEVSINQAYKFFNFKKNKRVLIVMGGSQGALKINQVFEKIVSKLNKYNIIWLVGKNNYSQFKKYQEQINVRIFGYLKETIYAFKIADASVSRAGAMSISERAFFGIPTIFIPLPHAAENHQYINAQAIKKIGGGQIIEEKYLDEQILFQKIDELLSSASVLLKYKKNIKKFHKENSEERIVDEIYKVLSGKNKC